ncbi:MAG: hypothetical protein A2091_09025 [Desulfuromonadales bacterium GWD2_61_12]|nr:MAG: hypothetical protein A2005_05115 [Desulfuromonadales bacterium GWC2_61_20]OGR33656.1 MAG: hypothetical protein A2091_09025 [Desulfuromonadales bacterium GWD2_61_12]HAD04997.1 hypothetical protein [Desulfuromonas sp.]HBT83714.1 hypothetical protein [Desulfuromonas sp.]
MLRLLTIALLLLLPATALAVTYACTVEKRYDLRRSYTREQTKKGQFSVRITEGRESATLRRCAFESKRQKISCDQPRPADRIEFDATTKRKKFYCFAPQAEVQLFSDLRFVDNNGRGGISFGTCTVAP